MTQLQIESKILKLAKQRKWGDKSSFILCSTNGEFLLNRTGLEKYKDEYKKLGGYSSLNSDILGYNDMRCLPIIDKWLINTIRTIVPETKDYTINLFTPHDEGVTLSYPPEKP